MEKFSYFWCLITNNEPCKTKREGFWSEMWPVPRCQEDGRGSTTQRYWQTNSSAEGLVHRHPPSSFPLTSSVGKTFIDLYCTEDSRNPKKWMVEVSGRPQCWLSLRLPSWYLLKPMWHLVQTKLCTSNTSPPFQPKAAKPLWVPNTSYTTSFTEKESNVWGWQEQR